MGSKFLSAFQLDTFYAIILYPQAKDHEAEKVEKFWAINSYVAGSYTEESAFQNLNSEMSKLEAGKEAGNRLFYLALPPSVFADVTKHIKATCMSKKLVRRKIGGRGGGAEISLLGNILGGTSLHEFRIISVSVY